MAAGYPHRRSRAVHQHAVVRPRPPPPPPRIDETDRSAYAAHRRRRTATTPRTPRSRAALARRPSRPARRPTTSPAVTRLRAAAQKTFAARRAPPTPKSSRPPPRGIHQERHRCRPLSLTPRPAPSSRASGRRGARTCNIILFY